MLELRAAMGLARLLRDDGRAADARPRLASLYAEQVGQSEGGYVKQAKSLLDELDHDGSGAGSSA